LVETLVKRDYFGDNSFLIFGYDKEGRLCSSKFLLGYSGVVTYISGGTSPAGLKNKVGYLLMWDAITFLKDRGFETFDLEGKNDPRYPKFTSDWGGFSHFKEKYGGISVEFPTSYIKYFHKVLRLASKIGTLPL
jgi:lipid II:glycine glycyltransferase (peptidoglycan interpeptide bridge formation enzyme)